MQGDRARRNLVLRQALEQQVANLGQSLTAQTLSTLAWPVIITTGSTGTPKPIIKTHDFLKAQIVFWLLGSLATASYSTVALAPGTYRVKRRLPGKLRIGEVGEQLGGHPARLGLGPEVLAARPRSARLDRRQDVALAVESGQDQHLGVGKLVS